MIELHLSVFSAETSSSDMMSIDIFDTLQLLYFVKKMLEHRYDIRISESCVDPNLFTHFQTQERCALEIAAYVFKPSSNFLTDRSKTVFLLWIFFVIYVFPCYTVMPLWLPVGKGLTSWLS